MRALAKLPADRFSSANEFAEALSGTRSVPVLETVPGDMAPAVAVASEDKARWRRTYALTGAVLAIAASVIGAVVLLRDAPPALAPSLFAFPEGVQLAPAAGVTFALSRDGRQLAFVGQDPTGPALYLRNMDALDVRPAHQIGRLWKRANTAGANAMKSSS